MQADDKAEMPDTPEEQPEPVAPEEHADDTAPETEATPDEAEAAVDPEESGEEALAEASGASTSDLEAELADAKDKLLRALAEAENVRRRASRDVENASKRAFAGFAREMIVVADNLSRALSAVDKEKLGDNDAVKSLLEGVEMTGREMQNAFERNGIQRIEPLGEKFDPQHHEAMFEYEDASKPAGSVGQILEVGYTLHGQPLRPAKVGVTKGGTKDGAPPTPSEQTLNDAEGDGGAAASGNAYEDNGKPSGSTLDEEL